MNHTSAISPAESLGFVVNVLSDDKKQEVVQEFQFDFQFYQEPESLQSGNIRDNGARLPSSSRHEGFDVVQFLSGESFEQIVTMVNSTIAVNAASLAVTTKSVRSFLDNAVAGSTLFPRPF